MPSTGVWLVLLFGAGELNHITTAEPSNSSRWEADSILTSDTVDAGPDGDAAESSDDVAAREAE
ncbi:MAG: hypothetical protein AAFN74_25395, partial [Myxococcota bacterium]